MSQSIFIAAIHCFTAKLDDILEALRDLPITAMIATSTSGRNSCPLNGFLASNAMISKIQEPQKLNDIFAWQLSWARDTSIFKVCSV